MSSGLVPCVRSMDKVLSLFLTINVSCMFSWGATMWGVLHSRLMLYEADDVHEAIMVHNPFLNISTPWQCTLTNSNTLYKFLYLFLGLLHT